VPAFFQKYFPKKAGFLTSNVVFKEQFVFVKKENINGRKK